MSSTSSLTVPSGREQAGEMKRWQMELMGVMLLTLGLVYLMGRHVIPLVAVLWLAGRLTIPRATGEGPIKAVIRSLIASLAAVGFLISLQNVDALRFMSNLPHLLIALGPISVVAFSPLLLYWLEDAYKLVPVEEPGRSILRGVVSLILSSFTAIGFFVAYAVACLLVHPVDGSGNFGWTAWALLFCGFAVPFYVTWRTLFLRDRR